MSYKLKVKSYNLMVVRSYALIVFFLIFSFLFSIQTCSAQTKLGHVNYNDIIAKMKGIDSIQNALLIYQADLQAIGEEMGKEFTEKQAALEKMSNSQNTSPAVLKIKQEELVAMYKRIQEFSDSMDIDIREKKIELLEPFQTKLIDAIKKIAKTNHYSYIFDISTLIFYSNSDDLTDKVKAELEIK